MSLHPISLPQPAATPSQFATLSELDIPHLQQESVADTVTVISLSILRNFELHVSKMNLLYYFSVLVGGPGCVCALLSPRWYLKLRTSMYYSNHSYCKYSYIDDQRSLCSDSYAFEDAHWAALGLADAAASTEEVKEHLAKETTTAPDVVAVDSPGIQIITKLSSVVPGAIVRRVRLVKPSAHQDTPYHDPCVVQVVTYGSLEQLNSARRLLEDINRTKCYDRSAFEGDRCHRTSENIKGKHEQRDRDCVPTPEADADGLASGVDYDITNQLIPTIG